MIKLKSLIKKASKIFKRKNVKKQFALKSYSQSGEDTIVGHLFGILKISNPSYVDIGCHHPYYLSNTACFYEAGYRGVCIEPDPTLFAEIKKARMYDICLNMGIGTSSQHQADFYLMKTPTLNTFCKETAQKYEKMGEKIEKVVKIPLITFTDVIVKHCNKVPDFVSLDTEGFDYEILRSIDFSKFRPAIFCVETAEYREGCREAQKSTQIIDYMLSKGYFVYADTYINSIFVDRKVWENVWKADINGESKHDKL